MPKAPPTLYNHNERPSIARILSVETSASGRRSVRTQSSHVIVPHSAIMPQATEYFPMDFNDNLDNVSAQESAPDPADMDVDNDNQPQESGVVGIKVKPPKAKRYVNSVGCIIVSL